MIGTGIKIQGQKQTAKVSRYPAPSGGIDARQSLSEMPIDSCIFCYNMTPSPYGMTLRNGYENWADNIYKEGYVGISVSDHIIKTIIPFTGTVNGVVGTKKLFAVTATGIFDITEKDQPPEEGIVWENRDYAAGNAIYCHYVTDAGSHIIFVADESNGLVYYDADTDTWAPYNDITGIDRANIVFIMVHKQRIWLGERGTSTGYYLDVGAIAGQATPFYFGSKFSHGGALKGLYNWSIDGGDGVDDILICLSDTGDVLPYKGSDPSDTNTWSLIGSFYIGGTPLGRDVMTELGGVLYCLSTYGVISMQDLLHGVSAADITHKGLTHKISPIISKHLRETSDQYGWHLQFLPAKGTMVISSPIEENISPKQYVLDTTTQGWGYWDGLPIYCMAEWNDQLYFGDIYKVHYMTGYLDKVGVQDETPTPIDFSVLTSFQTLGEVGLFKCVQTIRPDFLAHSVPSYTVRAIYDYRVNYFQPSSPSAIKDYGIWDQSKWDQAFWWAENRYGFERLSGASGMGRAVALAMKGSASSALNIVSFDVIWKTGGAV